MGAIALLSAWVLVKLPRALAIGLIAGLFLTAGLTHHDAVTGEVSVIPDPRVVPPSPELQVA